MCSMLLRVFRSRVIHIRETRCRAKSRTEKERICKSYVVTVSVETVERASLRRGIVRDRRNTEID